MALKSSKGIFLKIFKKYACKKLLVPQYKTYLPYSIINYSSKGPNNEFSIQMQAYMKRHSEQEKLLEEKQKEFELGKKHLANIMGKNVEDMTQENIDKAISYLFPSALFVPKSRPMMKPPNILYEKEPPIAFDNLGRPFHYLFYTTTPNFCQILHEASMNLEKLNEKIKFDAHELEPEALITEGSNWISHQALEDLCREKLTSTDYEKFLEIFEVLLSHPLNKFCGDFIMQYRKQYFDEKKESTIIPKVLPDGSVEIFIKRSKRKTAVAKVLLTYPGKGVVKINGRDITYFRNIQSREQILLPLIFTNMMGKVDVLAEVSNGGETGQAGAIRLGVSKALSALVLPEVALKMKIAGLLENDVRVKERKKFGKKRARRGYTWLKR